MKQVIFRNHQSVLDPIYFKVAEKETRTINKIVARNVELALYDVGEKRSCKDVVKENMKDYKGIIKAVGYDSPNKKFKDIINASNQPTKPST